MFLTKRISIEAAHQLQSPAWKHSKCSEVHGHTWHIEVTVRGEVNPQSNSVMDFSDLGIIMRSHVHARLDHKFLNDVLGVEDATSEFLCIWVWNQVFAALKPFDCSLHEVKVQETEGSWAVYTGD